MQKEKHEDHISKCYHLAVGVKAIRNSFSFLFPCIFQMGQNQKRCRIFKEQNKGSFSTPLFPDFGGRKLWRKGNTSTYATPRALNKKGSSIKHCRRLKTRRKKRERK